VCSANYADFVLATFTDNLYHERIKPDEQKIGECIKNAQTFFKICLLTELLATWYSRKAVMLDLLQLLTVDTHTAIVKKTSVEKWLVAIIPIASMAHGFISLA